MHADTADPWSQDKYEIKQKLLTIGQTYEILEENGEIVAICDNPAPGQLEKLRITFYEEERSPLLEIERMHGDLPSGRGPEEYFLVTDTARKEKAGQLELFGRKNRDGVLHLRSPSGAELATIIEKKGLGTRLRKDHLFLKKAFTEYRMMDGELEIGQLIRKHGSLGDFWRVNLEFSSGRRIDPRLAVSAVLVLDILN